MRRVAAKAASSFAILRFYCLLTPAHRTAASHGLQIKSQNSKAVGYSQISYNKLLC